MIDYKINGAGQGLGSYHGMEFAKSRTTILIVEDEAMTRMSSAATLEDAGFCVLEAGASAEALQLLLKHQEIGVLMTDVRLPGEMDGLDLVACVRRCHPAIRSIVVSGDSSVKEAVMPAHSDSSPSPVRPIPWCAP